MTVDQASVYLGVSSSTLNHWRSSGRGPKFVKLDRSIRAGVRYRLADLRGYVRSRTFSSVAEAELADAIARVGTEVTAWDLLHPFVSAGPGFLVDSAWADRRTLLDTLSNPFTRVRWMRPPQALALPWTRHERRTWLLQRFCNSPDGRKGQLDVEEAYRRAILRLPLSGWASHPDLTLDDLEAMLRVDLGNGSSKVRQSRPTAGTTRRR